MSLTTLAWAGLFKAIDGKHTFTMCLQNIFENRSYRSMHTLIDSALEEVLVESIGASILAISITFSQVKRTTGIYKSRASRTVFARL